MSKLYDDDLQIVIRDGCPCFFVDDLLRGKPRAGFQIDVELNTTGAYDSYWRMNVDLGPEVPVPQSAAHCVRYGDPWPQSTVFQMARPLQLDIPYRVMIDAGEHNRHGRLFCVTRRTDGELLLVETERYGTVCSGEPLNDADKPSLWQRLFKH